MASIILSDRLRGELEDLVTHTPLAKERSRAQALLWLADGESVEQVVSNGELGRNYFGREGTTCDTPVARSRRLKRPQPLVKGV